jgi:hypothetical protein
MTNYLPFEDAGNIRETGFRIFTTVVVMDMWRRLGHDFLVGRPEHAAGELLFPEWVINGSNQSEASYVKSLGVLADLNDKMLSIIPGTCNPKDGYGGGYKHRLGYYKPGVN